MNLTYEQATEIAGSLSYPSKMPCPSWGIDPKHCKTGAKLRKQKGTTCSICYACRGHYCYPVVRGLQATRLEGIVHPYWVDAMIILITRTGCRWFRWFDSGDLQGEEHFLKICLIAIRMPEINFWLPTQEHKLVHKMSFIIPTNITVRLTNVVINPVNEVKTTFPVAEVKTCEKENWPVGGLLSNTDEWFCPADGINEKQCGLCRACWDKTIPKIIYRKS